jgi:hypothetical protein
MQSLAFLWFEMQMTQQYLREETFGPAQSPDNSANLNTPIGAITLRRASVNQLSRMASAMERRVSGSPSKKSFRLIGSWFGKLAYNQGKNRREVVRSSR